MRGTLSDTLAKLQDHDPEKLLEITYQPQARFKVQAVTRCSSSIPGVQANLSIQSLIVINIGCPCRAYRFSFGCTVQSGWKVGYHKKTTTSVGLSREVSLSQGFTVGYINMVSVLIQRLEAILEITCVLHSMVFF